MMINDFSLRIEMNSFDFGNQYQIHKAEKLNIEKWQQTQSKLLSA